MTIEESGEIFANICMDIEKQAKALAAESNFSYRQVMAMIISALVLDLGGAISTDD